MRQITALILATTLLAALAGGCGSNKQDLPWETIGPPYNLFNTRDLERAQKEIPFRIIVPTYLPDPFPPPGIMGPLNGQPDRKLEVQIYYQYPTMPPEAEIKAVIEIKERNYLLTLGDPRLNPDVAAVEIAGRAIRQTEHVYSRGFPATGEILELPGFIFSWNSDGIYYLTAVYGYEYDVAVRVVESMIQQT